MKPVFIRANLRSAKGGFKSTLESGNQAEIELYRKQEKILIDWLIDLAGFERVEEIIKEI